MASTRWSTRAASSVTAALAACTASAPAATSTLENQAPASAGAAPCTERAPECFPFELTLVDVFGRSYGAAELTDRLIVVTFWATWANPSTAEIPVFNQVSADFGAEGVVILGIAIDELGARELQRFVADRRIAYPVVKLDPAIVDAFGMPESVPRTLIYDRRGRLQDERSGRVSLDELAAILQRLHDASR
jgi:thiol-disulfide isomerase/thioredoxin